MFMYHDEDLGPLAVSTNELNNVECEILDSEPEWSDEYRAACNLFVDRGEEKFFEYIAIKHSDNDVLATDYCVVSEV